MSISLPTFAGIPGVAHPSGCGRDCRHPHLTQVAATRLLDAGIGVDLVRQVLDDEARSHGEGLTRGRGGLSIAGRDNLVSWGANPREVGLIEGQHGVSGQSEDSGADYHEKARARAARSRASRDPEEQRQRNRDNAAAYRRRKAARAGKGE